MKRHWIFLATVVLACSKMVAAADSPNILFVFTDDQRADTIAALGNDHIQQ